LPPGAAGNPLTGVNPKSQIPNPKQAVSSLGFGTWDLGFGGEAVEGRVYLKPKRAQPFFGRHPWVFAGAIDRVDGDPADGAVVDLHSSAGDWIARGLFNGRSKIRVRLYSWEAGRGLDRDFFRDRIERAVRLREALGVRGPDRGCRLVFSEADGLSGCTIDEYAGWLTVQFTALGIAQRRELLANVLNEIVKPRG